MKLRFLTAMIASMALASSILGQSGGTFNLSPSTASGGGNTTENGVFSLTGAIGQAPLGIVGRKNVSIIGGIFGPKVHPFAYGDVNNDHSVNVGDVLSMANFLAGNTSFDSPNFNRLACDLNLDGKVNVQDLLVLANFLAGNNGLPVG
jgi:hypothetical protein